MPHIMQYTHATCLITYSSPHSKRQRRHPGSSCYFHTFYIARNALQTFSEATIHNGGFHLWPLSFPIRGPVGSQSRPTERLCSRTPATTTSDRRRQDCPVVVLLEVPVRFLCGFWAAMCGSVQIHAFPMRLHCGPVAVFRRSANFLAVSGQLLAVRSRFLGHFSATAHCHAPFPVVAPRLKHHQPPNIQLDSTRHSGHNRPIDPRLPNAQTAR